MGNGNSKETPNAYPIQPKPKPNPRPHQVEQIQYIPVVEPYTNQPINPYYGAQPIQQNIPQSIYPSLQKPMQQRAVYIANDNNNRPQQQQQQQQQPMQQPAIIVNNNNIKPPPINPQYIQQQQQSQPQPIRTGYIQVQGANGKQYMVAQGPPGTVPVVIEPKPIIKKKYKSWGVKIVATSDRAKKKVGNHQYEHTMIVIGIICEGDKYDGYGYSYYHDLDQKKFIKMKVKVTDQIAIQQNKEKHYLEFWKNGHMLNKVIALDPNKKFEIRVGSTNDDYDIKLY